MILKGYINIIKNRTETVSTSLKKKPQNVFSDKNKKLIPQR